MTVLCAHSSSKYYALTLSLSFPQSISVTPSLSPAISGYRMPHVALSALVIDSHVRWQIDHYWGSGLSNRDSGPLPRHCHYSLLPIDLCWVRCLRPGCPDQKTSPHVILPLSLSVPLPPACGQLSRQRTIRLMLLLHAFVSDAMELCVGAQVVAQNRKKGASAFLCCPFGFFLAIIGIYGVYLMDGRKKD